MEADEVSRLYDACKSDVEKFVVGMLVDTGMRAEELAMMNKDWIRWQQGCIQIPSCDEKTGWKPKTKSGARVIPITDARITTLMRAWFTLNDNVGLHRTSIWRIVKKVAARAGIKRQVYPHSLRATFASKLAGLGMSAATIQNVMGWASIITAQIYVKSSGSIAIAEFKEKWKPW